MPIARVPKDSPPPRYRSTLRPPPEWERIELEAHHLKEAAIKMLRNLSHEDGAKLCENINNYWRYTVGTMCSGTDLCMWALKAVTGAIFSNFGMQLKHEPSIVSKFSADTKAIARTFIGVMHCPPSQCICKDVCELDQRKAFDTRTCSLQLVDSVFWLVAGFCCTDVSRYNVNSQQFKDTIREGSSKTGGTFRGLYNYIVLHRPRFLTLENVTTIDEVSPTTHTSNLDDVLKMLESVGYVILTTKLSPKDHSVPHRRLRHLVLNSLGVSRIQRLSEAMRDVFFSRLHFQSSSIGLLLKGVRPAPSTSGQMLEVILEG